MIRIAAGGPEGPLWRFLLDLSERATNWTLIGARMVDLHALEHGRRLSRFSRDGDVLADARRHPNPVRQIAQILTAEHFEVEGNVFQQGHRFVRGEVVIDILAPDHLNNPSARVTVPPLRTVEVPGGRQALARTEHVAVLLASRRGELPRPNLLGAILVKCRAVAVDDTPEDQRRDLALLLSLVTDPEALARELEGRERTWVRRRREMDDPAAACWQSLQPAERQQGLAALRVLANFRPD